MAPRALRPFTVETKNRSRNPRPALPADVSDAQPDFPFDYEPDDLPVVDVRADMDYDEAMRAAERVFGGRAEDCPVPKGQAEQVAEPRSSPIEEPSRPRRILPSVIQPETEFQRRLREDQERSSHRGRSSTEEEKAKRADARKANAAKNHSAVVEDEMPPLLAAMEATRPDSHQIAACQELVPESVMEPDIVSILETVEMLQVQPSGTVASCTKTRSKRVAARNKNALLPGQRWKRRLPKVLR